MFSSTLAKPRKLPAEDTVSLLRTESIKESALNYRVVAWSGALVEKKQAFWDERTRREKKEMREFWEAEIS